MDIFEKIVAEREERVQDIHLDLPIPTWDGDMVARFDVLDREIIEKFANAPKRNPEMDLDFIIKATRELYIYDPERAVEGDVTRMSENEDYVRLEAADTHVPVRWDESLAEKLRQPDLKKSREVLSYCVKGNLVAVSGMATKLINWMQNTDSQVAGALVGESSAPTR